MWQKNLWNLQLICIFRTLSKRKINICMELRRGSYKKILPINAAPLSEQRDRFWKMGFSDRLSIVLFSAQFAIVADVHAMMEERRWSRHRDSQQDGFPTPSAHQIWLGFENVGNEDGEIFHFCREFSTISKNYSLMASTH